MTKMVRKFGAVKMTQADMLTELKARFGEDPKAWAFQCPACKDIATAADFRQALNSTGRIGEPASNHLGQVCIGRILGALDRANGAHGEKYKGRGCDWCAFGLIMGPMFVVTPEGKEVPSFSIAPAPDTREGVTVKPVQGHGLVGEGAPHDDAGYLVRRADAHSLSAGVGRAKCRCGELSEVLPSGQKRKAWHREHKAGVLAEQAS